MIYPKIISKIKESQKIAILSHIMPDGDNIGSSLALYTALERIGKQVAYILDDEIPRTYRFLKNSDKTQRPGAEGDFDLVIALDCGDVERLGEAKRYLEGRFVINIDHHISNTAFGDYNMVDSNASATGEIIYQIIRILGIPMDKDISECLYTAIVTDTGQFQYSNTTSVTHQIAGDLINNGVSAPEMYEKLYQNNPIEKIYLMKEALDSLEFYNNGSISCITLTKKQIEAAGAKDSDSEGIINLAREIENVEVAIFFREVVDDSVKVGFRSKKVIDVCTIAKQFGGGGHVRASGCTVKGSIGEVKEKVVQAVINAFE